MFFLGFFLLCGFGVRLWLGGFLGLHADEVYYWTWAQNLKLGYYDHPPMISWLIAASESLVHFLVPKEIFEVSPLFWGAVGLRAIPLFMGSVLVPLILGRSIEWVQRRPLGNDQIAVLLTSPFLFFFPQIITPDIPLFFGWSLVLLISIRLMRSQVRKEGIFYTKFHPSWAIGLGLALAFSGYSKYSAILAAFLAFTTATGFWNTILASFVCLLCLLPYATWSLEWASASQAGPFFQVSRGLGNLAQIGEPRWKAFGDLMAAQAILWSPIFFFGVFVIALRDLRKFFISHEKTFLSGSLWFWAFTPLAFFGLAALKQPAEANWPLVGALAAHVLLIARLSKSRWLMSFVFGFHCILITLVLAYFVKKDFLIQWTNTWSPKISEALSKPSRTNQFQDWKRFYSLTYENLRGDNELIEVKSYQLLSHLIYQDAHNGREEKIDSRLRIFPFSRKSEFHFSPKYMQDPVTMLPGTPYWLVVASDSLDDLPKACRLHTSFQKTIGEPRHYEIYKCTK